MEKLTVREIIKATSGTLINKGAAAEVSAVSTDTRSAAENDLFIALKGERYDAHNFLHQAFEKKCGVVVVSNLNIRIPENVTAIAVDDTLKALGDIAGYYRKKMGYKVIAVTGSNGKTTTKDIIGSILQNFVEATVTKGTENNLVGVPLTILSADSSKKVLVLELGINHFGEMDSLGAITQPDIVIVTNILASHIEFLNDEYGVFKAKSEICAYLTNQSKLILNRQNKYFAQYQEKAPCSIVSFGCDIESDYKAVNIKCSGNSVEFDLSIRKKNRGKVRIPVKGEHNVLNFLSAVAAIEMSGFKWEDIEKNIGALVTPQMRLETIKIDGFFVINDAYNANPCSTEIAVNELAGFETAGKKIMVFANMLELGEKSEYYHRQIGKKVEQSNIDVFITVGYMAEFAGREIKKESLQVYSIDNVDSLFSVLNDVIAKNDVVLLKGSRGNKLEKVISQLRNYYSKEGVV